MGRLVCSLSLVLGFALGLGGCTSTSGVPCSDTSQCVQFAAMCIDGHCHVPDDLDLSGIDLSVPVDAAGPADLANPDAGPSCAAGEACPEAAPICGDDQRCRPCGGGDNVGCTAHDVLTPRCAIETGTCSACRVASEALDCPTAALNVCGIDGSCRKPCLLDKDCDSGLCDPAIVTPNARSCARLDEIVYVQNAAGCLGNHAGTLADPVCSIDAALALRPNGGFIHVLTGTTLGPASTAITKGYYIFGDAQISAPDTVNGMFTFQRAGFMVNAGGRLYLDGIDIADAKKAAVTCDGGAVTIRNAEIVNTGTAALDGKNCSFTVEHLRIRNGHDAIRHDGGTLSVSNTFIQQNAGVAISTTASSTVLLAAYLTIVYNKPATSGVGGALSCGGALALQNSIVVGNQTNGAGTSHSGSCSFAFCDAVPLVAGSGTMTSVVPDFPLPIIMPRYFTLQGQTDPNKACCIDRAQPIAAVTDDFYGTLRGTAPDIGAHELP